MAKFNPSPELQRRCLDNIIKVLESHGFVSARDSFQPVENGEHRFVAQIEIQGRVHEIEVYEEGPVMLQGDRLFELELRREFEDDATVARSFAERLDRFLKTGEW